MKYGLKQAGVMILFCPVRHIRRAARRKMSAKLFGGSWRVGRKVPLLPDYKKGDRKVMEKNGRKYTGNGK